MVQVRWTIPLAPGIQPNIVKINSKFCLMYVTYQSNDQYISQQSADVILVENSKDRSPVSSSRTAPLNVKQHLSFKIYKQVKFCTFLTRCHNCKSCSQCRGSHSRAHPEKNKSFILVRAYFYQTSLTTKRFTKFWTRTYSASRFQIWFQTAASRSLEWTVKHKSGFYRHLLKAHDKIKKRLTLNRVAGHLTQLLFLKTSKFHT